MYCPLRLLLATTLGSFAVFCTIIGGLAYAQKEQVNTHRTADQIFADEKTKAQARCIGNEGCLLHVGLLSRQYQASVDACSAATSVKETILKEQSTMEARGVKFTPQYKEDVAVFSSMVSRACAYQSRYVVELAVQLRGIKGP